MGVSYGFYDAHYSGGVYDREYTATQLSSIFDGIIEDGIYSNVGDAMAVAPGSGYNVIIKTGRAWFKHTWTYIDSEVTRSIEQPASSLDRIDAVVVDINTTNRTNDISVVAGTPASTPVKPTLANDPTTGHYQYALAYVTVINSTSATAQGITGIRADDIEDNRGSETGKTPYVTGAIQSMSIDDIKAQWQAQWNTYFNGEKTILNNWATALSEAIDQSTHHAIDELKKLLFKNVSITKASFILQSSDPDYEEYPYRAQIVLSGAESGMVPNVFFDIPQITWGIFAPIAVSYNGGIYLYANSAPPSNFTIPTIIMWRGEEQTL